MMNAIELYVISVPTVIIVRNVILIMYHTCSLLHVLLCTHINFGSHLSGQNSIFFIDNKITLSSPIQKYCLISLLSC